MTIVFNIASIKHEDGVYKFCLRKTLPPLCIKENLLPRLNSYVLPTGRSECKLYLKVRDDWAITYMRLDYATLFDLDRLPDCTDIPVLPADYRATKTKCMKNLQHENCCSFCPWCTQLAPAGFYRVDYPAESFEFVPCVTH